ncbi:cell division protein FtsA [Marinicauda salina]|uniref:Cell division protein FtsA n=1 Tax=Marinicauda salina TaxID=2135793 RepID=A0A2U2BV27_9PROT|nr:cell division protein FtsA [Marinicauda salina]PWE17875.1 cell division protein FtsA [Marinicauda salina]
MSFLRPQDEAAAPRKPGLFAALDIGASKIVCFIVKTEQTLAGARPRVIGVGHQSSRGVRGGAVVDMDAAADAIREAVEKAERMAGHAVSEVTLVASAGLPASTRLAVEAPLSRGEITDRDLRRALTAGLQEFFQPGRVTLHAIPLGWRVDGHRGVKDPRGMFGRVLGVDLHIITAASDPLLNLISCVERCRLDVAGVVATPYAAGLAALAEDEMSLGAMIVDMGAHTTTLGVFAEGSLVHVDCLPVGGAHVTSDIARGLSTPLSAADRIKVLYGSALDSPDDDQVMIETPPVGGDAGATMAQQPRSLLNAVIRPRLEEVFELLRDRAETAGAAKAAGRRLVLTGGAAQLPGTAELAGRVLNKQVRVGRPEGVAGLGDAVSGPAFSACAGVIIRHSRGPAEAIAGPPRFAAASERRSTRVSGEGGPRAFLRWLAESF